MISPEQIVSTVQHGEICEVRYLGKACEVKIHIGPIIEYDKDSDMLSLPGGLHVRRRDVISLIPLQGETADNVKTVS